MSDNQDVNAEKNCVISLSQSRKYPFAITVHRYLFSVVRESQLNKDERFLMESPLSKRNGLVEDY